MKKVKKVLLVTLVKTHYTCTNQWIVQESLDGVIQDKNSDLLKGTYFHLLQEVLEDYLEKGFSIQIENEI